MPSYSTREDAFVIYHKEALGASWSVIAAAHIANGTFPRRSQINLQVRYSRYLGPKKDREFRYRRAALALNATAASNAVAAPAGPVVAPVTVVAPVAVAAAGPVVVAPTVPLAIAAAVPVAVAATVPVAVAAAVPVTVSAAPDLAVPYALPTSRRRGIGRDLSKGPTATEKKQRLARPASRDEIARQRDFERYLLYEGNVLLASLAWAPKKAFYDDLMISDTEYWKVVESQMKEI